MAWVLWGDTAASYPAMLNISNLSGADDRLVNEVFGFIFRCVQYSAEHWTDYQVPLSAARTFAGRRTDVLVDACVRVGVVQQVTGRDGFPALELIQDNDFFNIRTTGEREAQTQRNGDLRDPWLKVRVIFRDGDQCRWCGKPVHWQGNPGKRGNFGELDHLNPGDPGTVDTVVVACRACNGARQDRTEEWEADHPLWPIPPNPLYGKYSLDLFEKKAGKNWREHLARAAAQGMHDASEGQVGDYPGEHDQLAPAGEPTLTPASCIPGPSTPPTTGASEGQVGDYPGEHDQLAPAGEPTLTPAPIVGDVETHAVTKPVVQGREGLGSGQGSAGQVRDGPGRFRQVQVAEVSPAHRPSRRRRRKR